MKELAVFINQSGGVPVYEQIYEFIKREIRKGNIKTGERLPSTRNMSSYLQVSRSTVLASYEQLLAEGYIEARERKGYYAIEIEKDFLYTGFSTANITFPGKRSLISMRRFSLPAPSIILDLSAFTPLDF